MILNSLEEMSYQPDCHFSHQRSLWFSHLTSFLPGSNSGKETLTRQDSSIFKGVYRSTIPQLQPLRSGHLQSNIETDVSSTTQHLPAVSSGRTSNSNSPDIRSHHLARGGTPLCSPALSGSILASINNNVNIENANIAVGDDGHGDVHSTLDDINEVNDRSLSEAVDKILALDLEDEMVGVEPRPRVIMDTGESVKDVLFLTNIPKEMTYDRLQNLVEPFGETSIDWDSNFPSCASVHYEDATCAEEAMQYLSDSIIAGSENQAPLKAELRSRDGGTQLFVGDLTPDVTETMLEESFGQLVKGPVTAVLKRDPGSFSPIGYGFLSFADEFSAGKALVDGHRMAVGNAKVRVGKAERNTFLYVSDLNFDVSMDELTHLFGQHGALVEEDTVIVRRSYAFIRFRDRNSAESAKRTLDKTSLRSRMSVRYAEAEAQKSTVQIQFHSSVPRPPSSLKDLLHSTFSKYGSVESIDIPRMHDGMWRKTAFVHYHGDSLTATVAATDAVQNVKFVSNIPVLVQFARELIPRVSPKGISSTKAFQSVDRPQLQPGSRGMSHGAPARDVYTSNITNAGNAFHSDINMDAAARTGAFEELENNEEQENFFGADSGVQAKEREAGGRKQVYYPKSRGEKSSRSGSFDRSKKSQRRSASARRASADAGEGPSDVQFVPVYMPMSAMGHHFAPAITGMLSESDIAAAASGFMAPPFHGSIPPLMYPNLGQMQSAVPPGSFGYGIPMMGVNGGPYVDVDTNLDGFSG